MEVSETKQFKENIFRKFLYLGLILFSAFLLTVFGYYNSAKAATAPNIITYQGKLLSGGVSVTTTQAIKYVLYDAASSGNALYSAAGSTSSPSTVSTTPNSGLFSIDLGDTGTNSIDPAIFKNNQTIYLEVTVGGEALSPRKRITASPFALNSKYLDGIGASSTPQSASYIPISDSSGNFNFYNVTSTGMTVTGASSLSTTTISSSTIGSLNVSNNLVVSGLLSVIGNSSFGTITSGTWNGSIISSAYGGTGQNTSGWSGFVKATAGTWSTSTISTNDLTNSTTLAYLANNQTFTGANTFSASTTFASSTFSGSVGIGTSTPSEKLQVNGGNILQTAYGNPTLKGSLGTTSSSDVHISGKYAYVADSSVGLRVVNISNAASPTLTGTVSTTEANGVYVSGKYAYVADGGAGLRVVDISNAASPTLTGVIDTFAAYKVYVSGKYAYVADGGAGLKIVDITNPTILTLVGSVASTNAFDVYVSGKYAYVADGGAGLQVIDISNPNSPTIVGTVTLGVSIGVYVSGKYAYVADSSSGLRVVDISNPASPTLTGTVGTSNARSVYVSGNYAYIADSFDGLVVVNISNPASPTLVGTIGGNAAYGVHVAGKYAYVASANLLKIIDINGTELPSLSAGNIAANDLTVYENIDVGNNIYVRNGLNLGEGGLLSNGSIAITVSSTISTTTVFSAGTNTTSSILTVNANGTVSIKALTVSGNTTLATTTISNLNATRIIVTNLISESSTFSNATTTGSFWSNLITSLTSVITNLFWTNATSTGNTNLNTLTTTGLTTLATTTISSSTIGSLNVSNNLAVGGSVGIGTSTPAEKLHVYNGTLLVDSPVSPSVFGSYNTTGTVYAVDVSGKYAYVADGDSGLEIFEISNPFSPALVGYYNTTGTARDVKVSGKYVYVADTSGGLLIFDISSPTTPVLVGSYDTPAAATGVYISGKYAYVADINSFIIIDISNPKNPTLASQLSSVLPIKVYVAGDYAYLARNTSGSGGGLSIVNISNPLNPVLASTTVTISNSMDVYASGRYAYVTNGSNVTAYNISIPSIPAQVFNVSTVGTAQGVYASGRYVYVTDTSTFYVLNSSDGSSVGTLPITDGNNLKIVGKNAYVANGTAGFYILDIKGADISSANIGNIATNDLTVWENVDIGNSLSIKNGLNVGVGGILSNGAVAITVSTTISTTTLFSVGTSTPNIFVVKGNGYIGIGTSTPSEKLQVNGGNILHNAYGNPIIKSSFITPGAQGVYVAGKYAYVADITNGLYIIDISDPNNPTLVGTSSFSGAVGVYVAGKYAYVADGSTGLVIVDISNPVSSTIVGTLTTTNAFEIYVSGKYAYVADSLSGLRIIDISNPASSTLISTFSATNTVGVYISGRYAYLADLGGGLKIVDISSPVSPTLVGVFGASSTFGVYVSGKYAYIADNVVGLKIVNISNPASPTLAGSLVITNANGVYVSGKYAYVADVGGSMKVVDISSSTNPILVGTIGTTASLKVHVSGKYAYVADSSSGLRIIDINGIDAPTMSVGNIATNDLTVSENIDVGNNIYVRNGLNLGAGGLLSNGSVAITVSTTVGTTTLFSVGTTTPILRVNADGAVIIDGNMKIATTTGFGLGFSYKLLIDAGGVNGGAIGTNGFIRATSYISGTTTLDIAETYPINMSCTSNGTCPTDGDVICTDPTVVAGVKKCAASDGEHIIGIVSTNPGFLLGGGDFADPTQNAGTVKVALAGRVPVKISSVNGAINSGDKLTLSGVDGVAAKAIGEVPVVGVAMESYSGDGQGTIVAFVNLGWQNQIYKALTVDTNSSTLTVGSSITPYNLALSGEFTMFNEVLNKLVFNATALFESKSNSTHAFIFNAVNFGTSTDKYLLSLRSNNEPRFSVMSNGDVQASGNIYAASAIFGTSANPGDLAERVDIASDDIVEPGDVLVVDMNNPDTYRRSSSANQQAVAGVVSTNPTIVVGNGKTEYTSVLAMVGRVPLKVSDENGTINRGDLLVTASSTGYAMKYDPKKDNDDKIVGIVGVALDPFIGGKGKIMALVRTGWVNSRYETISSIKDNIQQLATAQGIVFGATSTTNLSVENNNNGKLAYSGGDLNLQGNMLLNVASVSGKNNSWSIDGSGHFITKINTSQGEKEMYAIQSPTSEFVFSSSSQLIAGEAKVVFDQTMQDIIDAGQPLKINITLTSGEAKGIYVAEKNAQGFTVKELDNGTSGATFDWMVVAKRKDESTALDVISTSTSTGEDQNINNQVSTSTNEVVASNTISSPVSSADNTPQSLAPTSSLNAETTPNLTPIPNSETISPVVVPVETVAPSLEPIPIQP